MPGQETRATDQRTIPLPVGGWIYQRLTSVPAWGLWFLAALWTLPTGALLVDSFRGRTDQVRSGFWTVATDPSQLTLDNYHSVLNRGGPVSMFDSLISSVGIAIPATVIPLALAGLAAYAFAFIEFRGREWLFIGTVSLMAVPFQVALIPLLTLWVQGAHVTIPFTAKTLTVFPDLDVNMRGTMAVWLTHTGFAIPFAIFLLHNAFAQLPQSLLDTARIDGADHVTTFRHVVVPLTLPAFASLAILQFLFSWNDFLVASTMTSGADPINLPATVRLANIAGEVSSAGPEAAAGTFVQIAVPVIVFFALQRHIVRGLLAGSVNG
ncbi:MAG: carbohydrate ABC transporter permease [Acidimicrobiales bacterium]